MMSRLGLPSLHEGQHVLLASFPYMLLLHKTDVKFLPVFVCAHLRVASYKTRE
jgi:hypothetical protein